MGSQLSNSLPEINWVNYHQAKPCLPPIQIHFEPFANYLAFSSSITPAVSPVYPNLLQLLQ